MGCKGSKHALHGVGCGLPAARPPEPQRRRAAAGRSLAPRHSVALRSSTLGTLSLDRAAAAVAAAGLSFDATGGGKGGGDDDEGMMKAGNDVDGTKMLGPSRSFGGWCPTTPPPVAAPPPKRQQKRVVAAASRVVAAAPRTPNKTPARDPEEINVWELMKGLDDDDDDDEETDGCVVHAGGVEPRKARSAPGSPVFDTELLDAFRKALDDLATTPDSPPPLPDLVKRDDGDGGGGGDVEKKHEIQTFPGIVRARVEVFQEKINAKTKKLAKKTSPTPPPPPESAGRVVVYLTSLRGIRHTYEACWSTAAILRSYGVRVDERDLSMHAGFKDELRAALGDDGGRLPPPPPPPQLPQVFADGRHLGGAEEVRRLHEAGELASALDACDAAPPCAAATKGGGAGGAQDDACARCGGVRFVPCAACSGSCKVFVEDADGGAFRRCPECNENGLVKCAVC